MEYQSILMKELKINNAKYYFGQFLFAVNYIGQIDISLFKKVDEQIEAMNYICLTIGAITVNKKQKESCQNLWIYINKERKKDTRITKEILKVWPSSLGDNIFEYYERKERKFVAKELNKGLPIKYLEKLSIQLKNLKYKMKDEDYNNCRDILLQSILLLLKVTSEYGFIPVILNKSIPIVEKFYPYYSEIGSVNVSEMESPFKLFETKFALWEITKNLKFLKEVDIAFEQVRTTEGGEIRVYLDKLRALIQKNKEYEQLLPNLKRYFEVSMTVVFIEDNVINWSVEVEVLQKIGLREKLKELTPVAILNKLKFLTDIEMNKLDLCKPLRNMYLDTNNINLCLVFEKALIEDMEVFADVWAKIIESSINDENEDEKKKNIDRLNESYNLKVKITSSKKKDLIIKY